MSKMSEFLQKILGDTVKIEIDCFSVWHFLWLIIIFGLVLAVYFGFRHKELATQTKVLNILAYLIIGLYILDFFLMPFSGGAINIDKLPFHLCTLTAVFIPFVQFNQKFAPIKSTIVCYAIVGALMYLTYPSTALSGAAYTVLQTLLFHGLVLGYGILSVAWGAVTFRWRRIWQEAVGLLILTAWAFLGNYAYLGIPNGHHYDWFFITGSTFDLPGWLMPFLTYTAVFGMCVIIYLIDFVVRKISARLAKAPAQN